MQYSAVYARSSLGRERQGETIEHQIEMIQEFAKRSGIDAHFDQKFIYEDEDSGFKTTLLQRPAMRQLLSDIESGIVDKVFFKGISRFARDSGETITTAKRLHNKGVRVISLEENFDSHRDDPTMFQIYAVMAEQESRKTGIRVSLGNKQKARSGLWSNASTPYGYSRVKDLEDEELKNKILQSGKHPHSLHPNDKAIVPKQVFDLFVNEGMGRKRIASIINEKGYRTTRGAEISDKFIKDMLVNEAYIGNVVYGKSRYEFIENDNLSKKIQRTVKTERGEWAIKEDAHPAIIDKEVFEEAQKMIERKSNAFNFGRKFNAAKHPLTGILKCGRCGAGMICQKRSNKMKDGTKKEYRYYVCSTYHKKGRSVCEQANVNADDLEEAVLTVIKKKVDEEWDNSRIEDRIRGQQDKQDEFKSELKLVDGSITKKMNAVKSLMESRDIYDTETFVSLNKELNDEIKNLRKQKEKIEANMKSSKDETKIFDAKMFIEKYRESHFENIKDLKEFFSGIVMEVVVEGVSLKKVKMSPFS